MIKKRTKSENLNFIIFIVYFIKYLYLKLRYKIYKVYLQYKLKILFKKQIVDEFDSRLNLDIRILSKLTKEDQERYIKFIYNKRNEAHLKDFN